MEYVNFESSLYSYSYLLSQVFDFTLFTYIKKLLLIET